MGNIIGLTLREYLIKISLDEDNLTPIKKF